MRKSDFIYGRPEESTGFLLWKVTNLWQREIKRALDKFGLTHSQFVLLASIHWFASKGENVSQIFLSSHTMIDPMTTSTVLRTLLKKGYIQRTEDVSDSRVKIVELTQFGISAISEAIIAVEKFDEMFFSSLQEHSSEFNRKLITLLEKQ